MSTYYSPHPFKVLQEYPCTFLSLLSNLKLKVMFTIDTEYSFPLRSFRFRNNLCFATVANASSSIEILIGDSKEYSLPTMLQAKQLGASVYGTFKSMYTGTDGKEYPKFWNVSIG
jgi:hypothetical protein